MFSYIIRTLLVSTSIAPALLAFAFLNKNMSKLHFYLMIGLVIFLIMACLLIIEYARKRLEKFDFKIETIKSADQQVLIFVIVYLLPLATQGADPKAIGVTLALLFFAILYSNTFHFNPILGFAGYHFYEVNASDKVNYLLLTRKNLKNIHQVQHVVYISNYMALALED